MSLKDVIQLFEQVATNPRGQAHLSPIDSFLRVASVKDCGKVVRKAKELIKSRKIQPEGKLQTLKLFSRCMDCDNCHFVTCVVHRFLRRLVIFASHRKVGDM